ACLVVRRPVAARSGQLEERPHLPAPTSAMGGVQLMDDSIPRKRGDFPFERIGAEHGLGCRQIFDEYRLTAIVVRELVTCEPQLCGLLRDPFGADDNGSGMVAVIRPLLQHVVFHEQGAAVGNLDQVAGGAVLSIDDFIADQLGSESSRFYMVPLPSLPEFRVLDMKQGDMPDIDAMRAGT